MYVQPVLKSEDDKQNENVVELTGQMAQICESTCPIKWILQSLWSSREVPQMEVIFSKRTLATEEAAAFLHGNASVHVKTCTPLLV